MGLRAYWEQESTDGITNRIEIDIASFTGTALELEARGEWFRFRHDEITSENSDGIINPYRNRIQKGTLDFYPSIKDSTDKDFLLDIVGESSKDVLLTWKQDGSEYWKGYVRTEKVQFPESPTFAGRIRATDFDYLKTIDYEPSGALPDGRDTISAIIADLVGYLEFDYNIEGITSLMENTIDDTTNYLHQIYADKYNLRVIRENSEDSPITVYEALENIANAPLIIRQLGGKWQVHQITAFNDPSSVLVTTYDSDGAFSSDSTDDLQQTVYDKTADGNPTVKTSSINEIYPGIKRVEVKFDHRTVVQFINFDDTFPSITLSGTEAETRTADQLIVTDGTQSLVLSGVVKATGLNGSTDMSARLQIYIEPSAGGNNYYWDQDDEAGDGTPSWENDGTAYWITQDLQQDGDVAFLQFSIKTDNLPAAADGTLKLNFEYADSNDLMPNLPADTTEYYGLSFEIKNPSVEEGNNDAINYRLTQVKGYQTLIRLQDSYFGDGPTSYSKARLTTDSAGDNATADTWGRRDGFYDRNYHEVALQELMDLQRGNRIKLSANMTKNYDPEKISVYG